MQVCNIDPLHDNRKFAASRSAIIRRQNRQTRCIDATRPKLADSQQKFGELEQLLQMTRSELEIAKTELHHQSLAEQPVRRRDANHD
jgi:hypothetical protein